MSDNMKEKTETLKCSYISAQFIFMKHVCVKLGFDRMLLQINVIHDW